MAGTVLVRFRHMSPARLKNISTMERMSVDQCLTTEANSTFAEPKFNMTGLEILTVHRYRESENHLNRDNAKDLSHESHSHISFKVLIV